MPHWTRRHAHDPARDDLGTARPRCAESRAARAARDRDPRVPRRIRVEDGRTPRAEPRRRGDDDRDPPGVRLAARRDRVRHRAPVVRAQAPHRPQGPVDAAQDRRPRGLPAALGVRARHRRELARVELAVVGRRHLEGLRDDRPARPPRRRRRRRRGAHGRHDVGGAEQHLRRQHPQAHRRRERQRPLLRADDRRHGEVPQLGADEPVVPEPAPLEQPGVRPARRACSRLLPRGPRRPPRIPQPVHRQRGALLEPRHQVRRPRRRPR